MVKGPQRRSSEDMLRDIDVALYGEEIASKPPHEHVLNRVFPGATDRPSLSAVPPQEGSAAQAWTAEYHSTRPLRFLSGRPPTAREGRMVRGVTPRSAADRLSFASTSRGGTSREESDRPLAQRDIRNDRPPPKQSRYRRETPFRQQGREYPAETTRRIEPYIYSTRGAVGPVGPYRRAPEGADMKKNIKIREGLKSQVTDPFGARPKMAEPRERTLITRDRGAHVSETYGLNPFHFNVPGRPVGKVQRGTPSRRRQHG
jgi:hypothetical protein